MYKHFAYNVLAYSLYTSKPVDKFDSHLKTLKLKLHIKDFSPTVALISSLTTCHQSWMEPLFIMYVRKQRHRENGTYYSWL